jgi:hypothetical protein
MPDLEEMLNEEDAALKAEEANAEEDKDFAEGFSGEAPKEEPKEEIKAEEQPVVTEQSKEEKKPSYEELETRLRKTEGTLGSINSRLNAMHKAGSEEAKKQKAKIPNKAIVDEAIEDPEKWKKLTEDFPEWAEGTSQYVDLAVKKVSSKIIDKEDIEKYVQEHFAEASQSLRNELKQELRAEAEAQRAAEIEKAEVQKIDKAYPEWNNVAHSDDFLRWLRVQDQETLKLYESDYATDVIKLLDRYHGKQQKAAVDKRLNGNIPATSRSSVTRTPPNTEDEDFEEGFRVGR